MCFKPPKQPAPVDTGADQNLARQQAQAEVDNAALKADNKQARMESALAALQGKLGRRSLFSGGQGGGGFRTGSRTISGSDPVTPIAPPTPVRGVPSRYGGVDGDMTYRPSLGGGYRPSLFGANS